MKTDETPARMTPRHADVAYVLEGVLGVADVYAIDSTDDIAGNFTFAIKLLRGGHLAHAHYALLRVLSRDECKNVLFFEVDLPPLLRKRASLSPLDREEARARVPETNAELEQAIVAGRWLPTDPARADFRVLIVDADQEVHRTVVEAFGEAAVRVIEPNPFKAFWKAPLTREAIATLVERFAPSA